MKYSNGHLSLMNVGENATSIPFDNQAYTTPLGETVRNTYTVPQGKRALVVGASFSMFKALIGAAAQYIYQHIRVTRRDGTVANVHVNSMLGSSAGEQAQASANIICPLFPGDKVEYITYDGSTGGIVFFNSAVNLIEWDESVSGER